MGKHAGIQLNNTALIEDMYRDDVRELVDDLSHLGGVQQVGCMTARVGYCDDGEPDENGITLAVRVTSPTNLSGRHVQRFRGSYITYCYGCGEVWTTDTPQ